MNIPVTRIRISNCMYICKKKPKGYGTVYQLTVTLE